MSFSLALSFFMMAISGIILYIAPPGRVARWSEWLALGLEKDQWEAQHSIFSYAFIVFALWHLFFINWKAFYSYLKSKTHKGLGISKELVLSLLVFVALFTFIQMKWQPLSPIMQLSDYASSSWERKGYAPPRPHAEEIPLSQLAQEVLKCELQTLLETLQNLGVEAKKGRCLKKVSERPRPFSKETI